MKPKTLVILQARMSSTRLPGKVLCEINGMPMIYWQIKRIAESKLVDKIIVATSEDPSDDVLIKYLELINQEYFRGSLNNVLERFIEVEEIYNPSIIVRLTADCPLIMPEIIDRCINRFTIEKVDYVSNILSLTFPDGLDVEVIRAGVLTKLSRSELSDDEKEHVTLGILNRKNIFTTFNIVNDNNLSHYRWTVDTQIDLDFVKLVFKHFQTREFKFNMQDMLNYVGNYPNLNNIKAR